MMMRLLCIFGFGLLLPSLWASDAGEASSVLSFLGGVSRSESASSPLDESRILLPISLRPYVGNQVEPDLRLESFKGNVMYLRASEGLMSMGNHFRAQTLDRFFVPDKAELHFKTGADVSLIVGAGSTAQVLVEQSGRPRLRLFKGKVRVENPQGEEVDVETLNAHAKVYKGKVDLKISAMNTLVAPREGEDVQVLTKKAHQKVSAGTYGLVMADGSLVFAGKKR